MTKVTASKERVRIFFMYIKYEQWHKFYIGAFTVLFIWFNVFMNVYLKKYLSFKKEFYFIKYLFLSKVFFLFHMNVISFIFRWLINIHVFKIIYMLLTLYTCGFLHTNVCSYFFCT